MGLETVTYISDLVATNPTSGDPKAQGDDHLRNLKVGLLNTLPGLTGAVTATHTEINFVADGAIAGTFTPVLEGATSAGTGTYTTQLGDYTRIGDRVFFNLTLIWTAHTGTGNMRISGLPYTSKSGDRLYPVSGICASMTLPTSHVFVPYVSANTSIVILASTPTGTSGASAPSITMDTAGTVWINGSYLAA